MKESSWAAGCVSGKAKSSSSRHTCCSWGKTWWGQTEMEMELKQECGASYHVVRSIEANRTFLIPDSHTGQVCPSTPATGGKVNSFLLSGSP